MPAKLLQNKTQQKSEHKRINRKGWYNTIVRHMVIAASLQKGIFDDGFLFQKQLQWHILTIKYKWIKKTSGNN